MKITPNELSEILNRYLVRRFYKKTGIDRKLSTGEQADLWLVKLKGANFDERLIKSRRTWMNLIDDYKNFRSLKPNPQGGGLDRWGILALFLRGDQDVILKYNTTSDNARKGRILLREQYDLTRQEFLNAVESEQINQLKNRANTLRKNLIGLSVFAVIFLLLFAFSYNNHLNRQSDMADFHVINKGEIDNFLDENLDSIPPITAFKSLWSDNQATDTNPYNYRRHLGRYLQGEWKIADEDKYKFIINFNKKGISNRYHYQAGEMIMYMWMNPDDPTELLAAQIFKNKFWYDKVWDKRGDSFGQTVDSGSKIRKFQPTATYNNLDFDTDTSKNFIPVASVTALFIDRYKLSFTNPIIKDSIMIKREGTKIRRYRHNLINETDLPSKVKKDIPILMLHIDKLSKLSCGYDTIKYGSVKDQSVDFLTLSFDCEFTYEDNDKFIFPYTKAIQSVELMND
ncbi:MAG: hypothetical protein AAF673_00695 [Pseudomonadota bacterium]